MRLPLSQTTSFLLGPSFLLHLLPSIFQSRQLATSFLLLKDIISSSLHVIVVRVVVVVLLSGPATVQESPDFVSVVSHISVLFLLFIFVDEVVHAIVFFLVISSSFSQQFLLGLVESRRRLIFRNGSGRWSFSSSGAVRRRRSIRSGGLGGSTSSCGSRSTSNTGRSTSFSLSRSASSFLPLPLFGDLLLFGHLDSDLEIIGLDIVCLLHQLLEAHFLTGLCWRSLIHPSATTGTSAGSSSSRGV